MFWGQYRTKIDDKSRLKIPKDFLDPMRDNYGTRVFVTSLDGQCVRIFPMAVWDEVGRRLLAQGPVRDPRAIEILRTLNHFGQVMEIDKEGRLLIHQGLRDIADMTGDVEVQGHLDYLEVWNLERISASVGSKTVTDADMWQLLGPKEGGSGPVSSP